MSSSRYWQKKIDVSYKNEICEVFERASQLKLEASFVEVSRDGPVKKRIFTYRLTAGVFTAQGQGPTIYAAKLQAAQQVLPDLRRFSPPPEEERPKHWKKRTKRHYGFWQGLPQFMPYENPVVCLEKLLTKLRGKPAEFTFVDVDNESDPYVITVQLTAAAQTVVAKGTCRKHAKKNAAAKLLNILGYNFNVSEPEPKPKQVLRDASENLLPQGAAGSPSERVPSRSEEEPPAEPLHVRVTSAEGPVRLREDDTSAAAPVDLLELLPADVLPMLATMEVIQNSNGKVQWCEPSLQLEKESVSDSVEVMLKDLAEIGDTFKPNVAQGEASQNWKAPEIEPKVTQGDSSARDRLTDTIQGETVTLENVTKDEKAPTEMLLTEVWSKLMSFAENKGIMEPTTTCKKLCPDVCGPTQTVPKDLSSSALETVGSNLTSEAPEHQEEVSPSEDIITSAPESTEKSSAVSDVPGAKLVLPAEALLTTPALVNKVFKMSGSDDYHGRALIVVRLQRKIKERLIVDDQCKTRADDFENIGKKAAKRLAGEYGSADALLSALQEPDNAALEEAVVKHLNSELRSFQNRPKSALSRFFSSVRRPFTSC